MGVQFPQKKHYVTLEGPLSSMTRKQVDLKWRTTISAMLLQLVGIIQLILVVDVYNLSLILAVLIIQCSI